MYHSTISEKQIDPSNEKNLLNKDEIINPEIICEAGVYNYIKNVTSKWAMKRSKLPSTKKIACSKKIKWTPQEDQSLSAAVQQFGEKNWKKVAMMVPGRTGKQCRERWLFKISPNIDHSDWIFEEDIILIQKQKSIGNKWSVIAEYLPGISAASIKNRWCYLCRRSIPAHSEEYKKIVNTLTLIYNKNKKNSNELEFTDQALDELFTDQEYEADSFYYI